MSQTAPKSRRRPAKRPMRLDALTLPTEGTDTTRRVLIRQLRRLERVFPELPVRMMPSETRGLYVEAVQRWRACRGAGKGAHILRSAHISVLLECTLRHLGPRGDHAAAAGWIRELSALVLTEVALLGALPGAGSTWASDGQPLTLRSPLANVHWTLPAETRAVRWIPGQVEALSAEGDTLAAVTLRPDGVLPAGATRPYHKIVDGVWLAEVDNNPLSDFEAHPDKTGNQLDLGARDASEWSDCLRRCFELLDAHLPALGAELRTVAQLVIPVGYDAERHLSASYQEYIGAAYMTLHGNDMTMVEALIHEFQHNKINAAFQQDPLLHNAFSPLYASPVRPDPRPLHGESWRCTPSSRWRRSMKPWTPLSTLGQEPVVAPALPAGGGQDPRRRRDHARQRPGHLSGGGLLQRHEALG